MIVLAGCQLLQSACDRSRKGGVHFSGSGDLGLSMAAMAALGQFGRSSLIKLPNGPRIH